MQSYNGLIYLHLLLKHLDEKRGDCQQHRVRQLSCQDRPRYRLVS
jgi:hypothetical protein